MAGPRRPYTPARPGAAACTAWARRRLACPAGADPTGDKDKDHHAPSTGCKLRCQSDTARVSRPWPPAAAVHGERGGLGKPAQAVPAILVTLVHSSLGIGPLESGHPELKG